MLIYNMSVRALEIGSEMLRRKIGLTIFDTSKISYLVTLTIHPNLNTIPVTKQYETSWNVVQNVLNFADMVITIPEFTENANLHYHILLTFTNDQIQMFNKKCETAEIPEDYLTNYIRNKILRKISVLGVNVLGTNIDVEPVSDPNQNLISYLYKDVDRTIKIGGYGILKYTIRANKIEDLKLEKLVNFKRDKKNNLVL